MIYVMLECLLFLLLTAYHFSIRIALDHLN